MPDTAFSFRQAQKLLRKLDCHTGDVLLIKQGTALATVEAIDAFIHACERLQLTIMVAVVERFDDLTVLNEAEMNKHGWYKIEALQGKIVRTPEKHDD